MPNIYQSIQHRERIHSAVEADLAARVRDGRLRGALPGMVGEKDAGLIRIFEKIRDDAFNHADRDLIVNNRGEVVHRTSAMGLGMYLDLLCEKKKDAWLPRTINDDAYQAFINLNVTALGRLARELGPEGLQEEATRWQFDLNKMTKPGVVPSGKDVRTKNNIAVRKIGRAHV